MGLPSSQSHAVHRRLLGLLSLAPLAVAGIVASAAAGAAATVATMVLFGRVVDALLQSPRSPGSGLAAPLAALVLFYLGRAACAGWAEWCGQLAATRVKGHLRAALVATMVARGPRSGSDEDGEGFERTGEQVSETGDGVEKLDAYYRRFVPQLAATAIAPPVIVAAVAWLDPASAVILSMTGPLIPIFMWLVGARAGERARAQWHLLRALSGELLEALQGLPTSILFNRAGESVARLDRRSEDYRSATLRVLRVAFLSGFVLELAATVSTALVAVGVGVRLVEGWIDFRPAFTVLLLAPEFYLPFRQLGQRHHAGMEGVAAAERIVARLAAAPGRPDTGETAGPAAERPAGAQTASSPRSRESPDRWPDRSIALRGEGLSYRYPGSPGPALSGLDFELQPGTLTALVGPSGAGKSTLVALVLRILEPATGCLVANGRPISSLDAAVWRRAVALVPQRPRFLEGTLFDALRYGRPDATPAVVREAARLARADAFIERLPRGYETPLGETGSILSAGERQRLALARALVRDAPILVLDEPTSSLDPATEAAITDTLAHAARDRTVLVVAHRLNTVRGADRILVLDRGRLTETGRHEDLLRGRGVYAQLAAAGADLEAVS